MQNMSSFLKIGLSYLFFCVCILHVESVNVKGTWRPGENFFHFLTKFGFQKTNPREKEITEGYIFGNITSKRNATRPIYSTLSLLPRKYFLDYYGNRTLAKEDPDRACQLMFMHTDTIAFDAQCHSGGAEDFLRRVPCPSGKLCLDEDNPKNVIENYQLTFRVQDIKKPRFWYLSMVACGRDSSCTWRHVDDMVEIEYDLNIVNGEPFATDNNPFEYHFSFDKQDTAELYLICVLLYGCILVPLQLYAVCRQVHPITRLFTAILIIELVGLLLKTLHLVVFSFNGQGNEGVNITGDLFNIVAQSLFMILLLLLAKGWAITRMQLSRKYLVFILWAGYSVLALTLYLWNMTEVDVIEDIDEYQTWPGWLTLVLRVVICCWYLYELRTTMTYEHNASKLQFFLHFGAASLVWFIYLPVVALIALQISPLWRYKLLLDFTYSADLLAHSFMTYLLWPERAEQYLLLAHEVDLSDELAEFNEAPHILNSCDAALLTPVLDYDTEPLKVTT
ncbi:transmembrane protein 145 [Oratosquilla oratoria]|uniref:transmembrane protein 145 n=1 Tax=Oratosquilla oratoria TaxID=337810 RepID=UPI003F7772D5